uniref:thioredoxin domain-containing protein 11 isoform X2 n=1 Tax=Myxine glutinosa TaxID=7769 RepID=UPI00358E32FE
MVWAAARRMACLLGAAAVLSALLLLVCLSSCRDRDTVWPAPSPTQFFSKSSLVVDFFLGQLQEAEARLENADLTMFVFYAPWCSRSVEARPQIELVARALTGQVQVIAINCWWIRGHCRQRMSFPFFPAVQVHHRVFGPIEYRGALVASYLQQFLERMLSPLTYLPNQGEILDFLATTEHGVLGFFDFQGTPQPAGFWPFYQAALLALRKNILESTRFGIVTARSVAAEVNLTKPGSLLIPRHGQASLLYPGDAVNMTAATVVQWMMTVHEETLMWLQPSGRKSLLLNSELGRGPALLVFLPKVPRKPKSVLQLALEEIVLTYNDCSESLKISRLTDRLLQMQQEKQQTFHRQSTPSPWKQEACCFSLAGARTKVLGPVGQSSPRTTCELCVSAGHGSPRCTLSRVPVEFLSSLMSESTSCSSAVVDVYSSRFASLYAACCERLSANDQEMGNQTSRTISGFLWNSWKAGSHRGGRKVDEIAAVKGLRCRTNRTLAFFAMDSGLHWDFAKRLGAPPDPRLKIFAAIITLHEELHHILEDVRRDTLIKFVVNYSWPHSTLRRHRRSVTPPQHASSVLELTADTFSAVVLDPDKDVLLLHYADWCGFCAILTHLFIQLATQLAASNAGIVVARINSDINDLPWEFVVDYYPTLFLFPARRKHHSVRYPADLPFSLPDLIAFILEHCSESTRQLLIGHNCSPRCLEQGWNWANMQIKLQQLQRETEALQETNLLLRRSKAILHGHLSTLSFIRQSLARKSRWLVEANAGLRLHRAQIETIIEQKHDQTKAAEQRVEALHLAAGALSVENSKLRANVRRLRHRLRAGTSRG